jgi:tRNA/tmRNA/rRNA uracil-C5-methylase (TrmA/RlmC/RlmD family)
MAHVEPCPHRPPCPGCPRYGEPGLAADVAGRLASLAARAGLSPPELVSGPRFGLRVRARLMVRGRPSSPKIGLFQAGSHRIADIPTCRVHHPLVNQVAAATRRAIRACGVVPYADRPHAGSLRALQVVVERPSGTAQVVLVGRDVDPAPLAPLADALAAELGPVLHSLWWNGNPERTNVVLGPHWHRWLPAEGGEAAGIVRESIGGADVFFPPGAFGQANLDLADRLVAHVHARVPDGSRVLELYAGCGPIGLGLLARSREVALVESAPDAVRGLGLGVAARPEAERARSRLIAAEAGAAAGLVREADVVIADPPRKGLDPALRAVLADAPPSRLVYVSCDLDSLEADVAALLAPGRLSLRELTAFDLFPNTAHVETVACLERDGG